MGEKIDSLKSDSMGDGRGRLVPEPHKVTGGHLATPPWLLLGPKEAD